MLIVKAVLAVMVLLISARLFSKASGSLAIKHLNIISFAFYNLLVFTWVGAFLIFMGFREHYLVSKIESEAVVLKTCLIIAYTMIALPTAIIVFNRLLIGKVTKENLQTYYQKPVVIQRGESLVLIGCLMIAFIGTLTTMYVFLRAGTVPLVSALMGGDAAHLRIEISRYFPGNVRVKNICMLFLPPMFSYLAYVYMRTSVKHKKNWTIVFAYLFVLSLIAKTYDLSKAPVVYYLFYFYLLKVILNNRHLTDFLIKVAVAGGCIMFVFYYGMMGYHGKLLTFSTGPLSRTTMQVVGMFLHVQLFPKYTPYLEGASLPTFIATLLGSSRSWIRSGRVVMEAFNPAGIAAGTAGVINSLFQAEAYANWGIPGVILAPVLVAFCLSAAYAVLLILIPV